MARPELAPSAPHETRPAPTSRTQPAALPLTPDRYSTACVQQSVRTVITVPSIPEVILNRCVAASAVGHLGQGGVGINTGDGVGDERCRRGWHPGLGSIMTIGPSSRCPRQYSSLVSIARRVTAAAREKLVSFRARLADRRATAEATQRMPRRLVDHCVRAEADRVTPQEPDQHQLLDHIDTSGTDRRTPVAGTAGPKDLPCVGGRLLAGRSSRRSPSLHRSRASARSPDISRCRSEDAKGPLALLRCGQLAVP